MPAARPPSLRVWILEQSIGGASQPAWRDGAVLHVDADGWHVLSARRYGHNGECGAKKEERRPSGHGASVSTLLANAGEDESLRHLKWFEPEADTCLLVHMPAEMLLRVRRSNEDSKPVPAGAEQLDVVTVMRAIIGHHGHHRALSLLVAVKLYKFVTQRESRH